MNTTTKGALSAGRPSAKSNKAATLASSFLSPNTGRAIEHTRFTWL